MAAAVVIMTVAARAAAVAKVAQAAGRNTVTSG